VTPISRSTAEAVALIAEITGRSTETTPQTGVREHSTR
jgi:hypothetical protein